MISIEVEGCKIVLYRLFLRTFFSDFSWYSMQPSRQAILVVEVLSHQPAALPTSLVEGKISEQGWCDEQRFTKSRYIKTINNLAKPLYLLWHQARVVLRCSLANDRTRDSARVADWC